MIDIQSVFSNGFNLPGENAESSQVQTDPERPKFINSDWECDTIKFIYICTPDDFQTQTAKNNQIFVKEDNQPVINIEQVEIGEKNLRDNPAYGVLAVAEYVGYYRPLADGSQEWYLEVEPDLFLKITIDSSVNPTEENIKKTIMSIKYLAE